MVDEHGRREGVRRHRGRADRRRSATAKVNKELEPRRNLIIYLGASLANFVVPVGVPLLRRMAGQTAGMEPTPSPRSGAAPCWPWPSRGRT